MKDEERERAVARFRTMRGRGLVISYVAHGPIVPAKTPGELREALARLQLKSRL